MERRLAQIEESVARYLHQLDSADREEQSLARETKNDLLEGEDREGEGGDSSPPKKNCENGGSDIIRRPA